jgi:molybdenum cofactor cytidylyltransferase
VKIAGILLAAGRSTRFGTEDKLRAPLHGRPLLHHAADAMRAVAVEWRFLVRSEASDGLDGFETISVAAGMEMSRSLAAGIIAAREAGADAALVTLGDMPFVTADHLATLIDACTGRESLLASEAAGRRSPPALFGANWFPELATATGDAGGRHLLARAIAIPTPMDMVRDIDTPTDLNAAASMAHSSEAAPG